MDRFAELEAFVRVVDAGSFVEAARQLGISPPVVTRRVNDLERRLQVRLLQRTTRRLSVTEAGQAFHPRAVAALESLEQAEASVGEEGPDLRGQVRVSAPTSFGVLLLAPLLCEFRADHPGVTVELLLNDRPVNPVAEGFDLVLDDSGNPPPNMVARPMATIRRVLCASPQYLARRGEPREPRELADHDCIQYRYLDSGSSWLLRDAKRQARVRITPTFTTDNGQVMLRAAVEGAGIALLPSFLAVEAMNAGTLRCVLPAWRASDIPLQAVYPHRAFLPSRVRLLVERLLEHFSTEPLPWEAQLIAP